MNRKIINAIGSVVYSEFPLFLLTVLLLSIPAGYKIEADQSSYSFSLFLSSVLQSIPLVLLYLSLVKYVSKYFKWVGILFLILFIVETYAHFKFNQRMSPLILSLILQTDSNEVRNFFSTFIFNYQTLFGFGGLCILSVLFWGIDRWWKKSQGLLGTTITGIIGTIIIALSVWGLYDTYEGLKTRDSNTGFNTMLQFAYSFFQVNKHKENIDDIAKANENVELLSVPEKSPVLVCVIGESFIKRHSSLYGYPLQTNPHLEKERDAGNLFVFTDVLSPYPSTNGTMEMFYSIKSSDDTTRWSGQPLFPAVFKKAGYKVSLIDFQFTRSRSAFMFDFHCSFFLNPAVIHQQCFDFRNDTIYLNDGDGLDNYLHCLYHSDKALNIVHLQGQHLPATAHYPNKPEWEIFTREDIKRTDLNDDQRLLVAQYDNCTYYNDSVLKRIINAFKEDDAVIVYFSDHGEQLYDDSRHTYGRTFGDFSVETIKCMYEIPFMIWVSDHFKDNHPELLEQISAAVNKPFSNDDVPFLLFDLAGIDFKGNHLERSIISPSYKSHERILWMDQKKYNYDRNRLTIDSTKMLVPMKK